MKLLLVVTLLLGIGDANLLNAQAIVAKYALDYDGELVSAAFSPDAKLLATISGTKTDVWLWDSTTGKLLSKLSSGKDPRNYVNESNFGLVIPGQRGGMTLTFGPDGNVLAVAAQVTKDVRIWDVNTGKLLTTFTGVRSMMSSEFSPDGKLLALAMGHQGLKLIDVDTGQLVPGKWDFKYVESVTGAAFSKDGKTLIVAIALRDDAKSGFYFVDLASGKIKATILAPASHDLVGQVSLDRSRCLTFESSNNDLKIWDVNTGQLTNTISTGKSKIVDAAISYDGKTVGSVTKDGTVQLWESETSERKGALANQKDKSTYFAFGRDSQGVLVGSAKGARLWDIAAGVLREPLVEGPFYSSPDGRLLVTARKKGGAQVWQIQK